MSSSDQTEQSTLAPLLRQKRRSLPLFILFAGIFIFVAAAGALYIALRPVTLRIAVGPSGSEDQKLIQALAQTFARQQSAVRLSPIATDGAAESIALLGASKTDLAVARGDLEMHDIMGSRLDVFDKLGHVPHEEDPIATVAAVQSFLEQH